MPVGASAKLASALVSAALLSASGPVAWTEAVSDSLADSLATFGDEAITPESANNARFGVEQTGKQLSSSGAHDQAAELYWTKGIELKDPLLIVEAAEAGRDHARAQRSTTSAQTAIDRVQVALDMLYFLRDGAASENWQPIAPEYLGTVIERARAVQTDAQALLAEIEAELAAASAPPPVEEPKKKGGPGMGLIIGGSAALAVGVGGAALGIAGLALGASAQSDVEDPTVYEPEHGEAEARGRRANVLAGVGIGLGAVGLGAGVALIYLGLKKRKQAGATTAQVLPSFGPEGAGLSIVGRF